MKGPTTFWLVRHGDIDGPKDACVGWTDVPPAPSFDALAAAHNIAAHAGEADAVYSSDLSRCYSLAQKIAAVVNAPLRAMKQLRELNFGAWEMMRWEEIGEQDPARYRTFMDDWTHTRIPDGESYVDLQRRVTEALAAMRSERDEGTVIVVGHAGSLRVLAKLLLNLSDEEATAIPMDRGRCARIDVRTGERSWNIDPSVPPDASSSEGQKKTDRRGMLIVYTGDGKGKTTAALGTAMRALGRGWKVAVAQFIKGAWKTGEGMMAPSMSGLTFETMGRGFTWESKNLEQDIAAAKEAWVRADALILSGDYQLVILDEITYPINFHFLPIADVMETLAKKPPHVHVIVTGRDALKEILEAADLVTEMKEIKHPFREGRAAVEGIDY
ncbi:MAG: cob(I)yrinic acid a,c-diamide adenosyltransferase [Deltaproteobacteria bacterium]|nr:cob(I)yrinic acid a,c-diamide adenosyltransferase [Deltaproteobacteria bacterium]